MLSYKEALEKVLKHSFPLRPRPVSLEESLGLVLAKDVFALTSLPNFDNSAVDGYAVRLWSKDKERGLLRRPLDLLAMTSLRAERSNLKLQGEVKAGEFFRDALKPGHAIRIFTGAPIPRRAQAVVMQENTERMNGSLLLLEAPRPKENIRFKGEDVQKDKLLLRKGTALEPTHLALLAAVGYTCVPVYPAPKISILSTGSELLAEGERLKPGKIHDCNSVFLKALARQVGGVLVNCSRVRDDPQEIRSAVRKGLKSDLFMISGGVSVGAYDCVKEILREEGVEEIFWKVNMKPGKPIFFGRKKRTLVFGLPGNPVSVFVTFEEFVKPALVKLMGKRDGKQRVQGDLTEPFQNGSRLHFVRVRCVRKKHGYMVTPLKGQGSHMVGSLALANALLRVKPNASLKKNERVSVTLIGKGEKG